MYGYNGVGCLLKGAVLAHGPDAALDVVVVHLILYGSSVLFPTISTPIGCLLFLLILTIVLTLFDHFFLPMQLPISVWMFDRWQRSECAWGCSLPLRSVSCSIHIAHELHNPFPARTILCTLPVNYRPVLGFRLHLNQMQAGDVCRLNTS